MKNGTLNDFLVAETARGLEPALAAVVRGLAQQCADLSGHVSRASALGLSGDAGSANVQGESQKKLDVLANELLLAFAAQCPHIAGVVSEELDNVSSFERAQRARYLLVVDPLDGSSNVDANISVGTIFSVLRFNGTSARASVEDFLQPGTQQLCAGYAIYGPSTLLSLTLGRGTHTFTFDWATSQFVHTAVALRVPEATREFAINMSNRRFWEVPVQALRRGVLGRRKWSAWSRLQHALDRFASSRGTAHFVARWNFHVSARHERAAKARAFAPALRGKPDRATDGAGGRRRVHGQPTHS